MQSFLAAIFDVDGVLVDSPHEQAWRDSLRELMEGDWADVRPQTTWSPQGFTSELYQQRVSGRARLDGARAALDAFGVPGAEARAVEYAARKQALLERLAAAGDFSAFDDAVRFLAAVRDAGMSTAAASSSRNAGLFLSALRLGSGTVLDALDADVSGRPVAHGKPHPDIFLAAAGELGVPPGDAVVVEDAPAGVQAAKAGGMAALAVARRDDADVLAAAGADLVVSSLDEVDVGALVRERLLRRRPGERPHADGGSPPRPAPQR